MALRESLQYARRCFHMTPARRAIDKLPFEKPIMESEILDKAIAEKEACKRFEFYGNVAVVLAGVSATAKLAYYLMYGKEGGAEALPRRSETRLKREK